MRMPFRFLLADRIIDPCPQLLFEIYLHIHGKAMLSICCSQSMFENSRDTKSRSTPGRHRTTLMGILDSRAPGGHYRIFFITVLQSQMCSPFLSFLFPSYRLIPTVYSDDSLSFQGLPSSFSHRYFL